MHGYFIVTQMLTEGRLKKLQKTVYGLKRHLNYGILIKVKLNGEQYDT